MKAKPSEGRTKLLLDMSDTEAGQLMRYISQYKSGGFQNFMRKLVLRALDAEHPPTRST